MTSDYTRQDRTVGLSSTLPAFVLPADGSMTYVGNYRQTLFDGKLDHKISSTQSLMVRFNYDHFYDTNPNDAVGGTSAPTVARQYSRGSWRVQANHTAILGSSLLNEARFAYLNGDPVTLWEAQELSTTYTRSGSVPFTIGQSRVADLYSRSAQFADTLTWSRGRHDVRFGGSVTRHISGGTGSEPGMAVLGTFTFKSTTTAPFDQLTLADVQQYTEPISYGITSYELKQWLTVGVRAGQHPDGPGPDAGRRAAVRPADPDRRQERLGAARGIRLAPGRQPAAGDSRRLQHVLHADSVEPAWRRSIERPRRADDVHGDAGTGGLPHLPRGAVRAADARSEDGAGLTVAGA